MHHEDKRGMFNIHRDLQNFVHKPRPNSLIEHSSVGTKLTKSGSSLRLAPRPRVARCPPSQPSLAFVSARGL